MLTFCQYINKINEEKTSNSSDIITEAYHTRRHGEDRGTTLRSRNDKSEWNDGKDKAERRGKKQSRANKETAHLVAGTHQKKEMVTNFKTGIDSNGHEYVYNAIHDNSNFRSEMRKDDRKNKTHHYKDFLKKDREYHQRVRNRLYRLRDSARLKNYRNLSADEKEALKKLGHIYSVDVDRKDRDDKLRKNYKQALKDLTKKIIRLGLKDAHDLPEDERKELEKSITDHVFMDSNIGAFTSFRADVAMPYAIDRADSRDKDEDDDEVTVNKYNLTDVEKHNIRKMESEVKRITNGLSKKIFNDDKLKKYFRGKGKELKKLTNGCFEGASKMTNLTSILKTAEHSRKDLDGRQATKGRAVRKYSRRVNKTERREKRTPRVFKNKKAKTDDSGSSKKQDKKE